jgi:hypothetical protein
MKGNFVSIWDGGDKIITPAELDVEIGEVTTKSVDADVEHLDKEYFEDEDGNEYAICPECHEYILKTVMKDGIGKTLYEALVCSNPDCENQ